MRKARTFIWFLVIMLAITLLAGCKQQPSGKPNLSQPSVAIEVPNPPSGKGFRFEEVEVFQTWPLPTSLVTQIKADKLTYKELWGVVFDWLPEIAWYCGKDIPILRTPKDGVYYPNQFYIHPDFDKILGKGVPREKIGVFFVKTFDEELADVISGEPIALGDKLAGFYIDCKLVNTSAEAYFRLSVDTEVYFSIDHGTTIVHSDYIDRGVDGWVYMPQP